MNGSRLSIRCERGDAMTEEREMFRDPLELTDEQWADFRRTVLGQRDDCPSLEDLFDFAMQRCSNPEQTRFIGQHCLECQHCRVCAAGFAEGAKDPRPGSNPPPGSALQRLREAK